MLCYFQQAFSILLVSQLIQSSYGIKPWSKESKVKDKSIEKDFSIETFMDFIRADKAKPIRTGVCVEVVQ